MRFHTHIPAFFHALFTANHAIDGRNMPSKAL